LLTQFNYGLSYSTSEQSHAFIWLCLSVILKFICSHLEVASIDDGLEEDIFQLASAHYLRLT
jgi:hypothetical protein